MTRVLSGLVLVPVAALAATVSGVGGLAPSVARACSAPEAAIVGRDMFPQPASTGVPTNVRVIVSYDAGGNYGPPADAGDPGFGPDLELRRKTGTAGADVAVDKQAIDTSLSWWRRRTSIVMTPAQPLAPATEYEVVDRRPNIPCGPSRPASCALGAVTVVGAFTTAAGPDNEPPAPPTGATLVSGAFDACTSSSCCGPYLVKRYIARWDEPSAWVLRYNVYGGDPTGAVVRLLPGRELSVAVRCAGGGDPGAVLFPPGPVQVRAVDLAGHEGPAVTLGSIPATVCDEVPADAGVDLPPEAGPDRPPDNPVADAGADTSAPVIDGAAGQDAATGAGKDAAGSDTRAPAATPSSGPSSGWGCRLGGGAPPAAPAALVLLGALVLVRRRR